MTQPEPLANWGPVSVQIGPGTVTPDTRQANLYDSGTFAPGALTRISGTADVTFSGGRSDAVWFVYAHAFAANGDTIELVELVKVRLTTTQASFNYNVPTGCTHLVVYFQGALYQGQTMFCTASGTLDSGTFCAFGTRAKSGTQSTVVLTTDNIAELLARRGYGWLGIAFQLLAGIVVDVTGLCGLGPPQIPQITTSLLEAPIDEVLQVFKRIMWDDFCECVPGSPTPTPYPPYSSPQPVTWPTAPTFPCDPADLCASLSQIRATLNALVGSVAATRTEVELLQRYGLPFAYIRGATHSNLTGKGQFAISRLVGLDIDITTVPPGTTTIRGNPEYFWNMGWLAIEDDGGMLVEKRLTRTGMVWLPKEMPTALRFNYDLFEGVVVRVTELQAEP